MNKIQLFSGYFLAVLCIISSVGHILNPDFSSGLIPDFLPKMPVHVATAIVEFALGVGVFIPKYRTRALQGIFLLMIAFLPLHIWDLFREDPLVTPFIAAVIRVLVQFLFIYMAWYAGGRWKKVEME